MKFWIKGAVVIIPALVLIGCGTSGDVQEDEATSPGQVTSDSSTSSAFTSGVGTGSTSGSSMGAGSADSGMQTGGLMSTDPLDDPNSLLATRVIYFDLDKSDVRSDFQDVLQAHAEYLAAHPQVSITLEGHCDERGTREYNIALGERRAQAVQRILTLQGVSASQIRTISYGEERPAAMGQDESAYSLNRRAEIIYKR